MTARPGRLGIYVDARYRVDASGRVSADIPFVCFACEVGGQFDSVALFGRHHRSPGPHRFPLGPDVTLLALPDYDAVGVTSIVRNVGATARGMWKGVGHVDAVWIFGPHPYGLLLAGIAALRRRPVAFGVRQNTREYFDRRARGKARLALPVLNAMDSFSKWLSRRAPTVVVGDDLARTHGGPRRPAIVTTFSQMRVADMTAGDDRSGQVPRVLLNVGRIAPEKNPLLLVAAMAELERRAPGRFRLRWVGGGPLEDEVRRRAHQQGVADRIDFLGYVPFGPALVEEYRRAFAFVHVSLTEGVPQVLFEAMGSGTPVVATDVGGVSSALEAGRLGTLVPPSDLQALVDAILELDADPELWRARARQGLDRARLAAFDVEARRLGGVLRTSLSRRGPGRRRGPST